MTESEAARGQGREEETVCVSVCMGFGMQEVPSCDPRAGMTCSSQTVCSTRLGADRSFWLSTLPRCLINPQPQPPPGPARITHPSSLTMHGRCSAPPPRGQTG
eukprot:308049-Rhodomonas_salina.2